VSNQEKEVMPDPKQQKVKRQRRRQTYQYHKSAVSISVYDPMGATIPVEVRKELEESVLAAALANKLLINIAYE
jgi:hypothetical protein